MAAKTPETGLDLKTKIVSIGGGLMLLAGSYLGMFAGRANAQVPVSIGEVSPISKSNISLEGLQENGEWPELPADVKQIERIGDEIFALTDGGSLLKVTSSEISLIALEVSALDVHVAANQEQLITIGINFLEENRVFQRDVEGNGFWTEVFHSEVLQIDDVKVKSKLLTNTQGLVQTLGIKTEDGQPWWAVGSNRNLSEVGLDFEFQERVLAEVSEVGDITDRVLDMARSSQGNSSDSLNEAINNGLRIVRNEAGMIAVITPENWFASSQIDIDVFNATSVTVTMQDDQRVAALINMEDRKARVALGNLVRYGDESYSISWDYSDPYNAHTILYYLDRYGTHIAEMATVVDYGDGTVHCLFQDEEFKLWAINIASPDASNPGFGAPYLLAELDSRIESIEGVSIGVSEVVSWQLENDDQIQSISYGQPGAQFDSTSVDFVGEVTDWDYNTTLDESGRKVVVEYTVTMTDGITYTFERKLVNGIYQYIPLIRTDIVDPETGAVTYVDPDLYWNEVVSSLAKEV